MDVLRETWSKSAGDSGYNPDADCNGDGVIGAADFACFAVQYGRTASSGLDCAGTIPCPAE